MVIQDKISKRIHIGTSGWHYDHWTGKFYPGKIGSSDFLDYYSNRFRTVEINNSFYRMPSVETLRNWRDTAGEDFIFSIKASRYITHMKKLRDPEEPVERFLERAGTLEGSLGPVLFQLPPGWTCDPERLKEFLSILPEEFRYTMEFRDESWFNEKVYRALEEHNVAFCIYHLSGRLSPRKVTADFVYVRLHGPEGAYRGSYDHQTLGGWVGAFSTWAGQGKEIYCYFDNDEEGYAPRDASVMKNMLGS